MAEQSLTKSIMKKGIMGVVLGIGGTLYVVWKYQTENKQFLFDEENGESLWVSASVSDWKI